jgi:hypothetical protein
VPDGTTLSDLTAALKRGLLWALERATRVATFVGFAWVVILLDGPSPEISPKLTDATVNDLAAALFVPMLLVIFFWHVMRDDR